MATRRALARAAPSWLNRQAIPRRGPPFLYAHVTEWYLQGDAMAWKVGTLFWAVVAGTLFPLLVLGLSPVVSPRFDLVPGLTASGLVGGGVAGLLFLQGSLQDGRSVLRWGLGWCGAGLVGCFFAVVIFAFGTLFVRNVPFFDPASATSYADNLGELTITIRVGGSVALVIGLVVSLATLPVLLAARWAMGRRASPVPEAAG
jgi:hypothetical protein